jgi:hypothetical protein
MLSANRVVGASGNGTFIQTGGNNKGVALYIGLNGGGGNGSFSISGGSASANIIVVADLIGSVGSMTVSDTAAVQSDILRIGNGGAASFTQTGRTVSTTTFDGVSVAAQADSTATVSLSGGTLDTETFAIGGTGSAIGGIGAATIGGTAAVTVSGTLHLWGQPFFGIDSSTLDMTAGTLTVGAIDLHDAPNRLTWTGGTLHVTNSHVTVGPPPEFSGGLTGGQLGPSRVIGPNQQLVTGSAAQVAALVFWGGGRRRIGYRPRRPANTGRAGEPVRDLCRRRRRVFPDGLGHAELARLPCRRGGG